MSRAVLGSSYFDRKNRLVIWFLRGVLHGGLFFSEEWLGPISDAQIYLHDSLHK
jgi:hypothetical protein